MTVGVRGARGAIALGVLAVAVATPSHPRTQATPPEPATLTLVDQDFAIAPDAEWTAHYTFAAPPDQLDAVAPTGSTSPSVASTAPGGTATGGRAAVVRVSVHRPVRDRTTLQAAFAGDVGRSADTLDLALGNVVMHRDRTASTIELAVPTSIQSSATTLSLPQAGLYPISVEVLVDDEAVTATHVTFLDRLPIDPDEAPAMGVAVVAAIDDPGSTPDEAQLDAIGEQLDALVALGSSVDAPLTVAIPPNVEQVLDDDPELAGALRDALDASELFALPARQLDPSSAAAADRSSAFSRELRDGEDVLARVLPQSPTRRAAWIVTAPLSATAASQLRDPLGFRMLLLDGPTYASLEGNISSFVDTTLSLDVALEGGGTLPATVLSPLGAELAANEAKEANAAGSPADAAMRVLTSLVTARRELGPALRRNVALATADLDVPDPQVLKALAELAADSPDVTMTTLSRFVGTDTMRVDGEPVTLQLPATAGVDLGARAGRIDLTRVAAVSAASMTTDGGRLASWQAELDALISTEFDDAVADAALDRIGAEISAVLASVQLPEPFTFTLTGRRSMLRVNVRNEAEEDRIVIVRPTSSRLRFPDGDQKVTVPPGVTEVLIPVEARGNGTSSVEIQLLTPVFAQRAGPSTFLTARVNALTGLGQVITGGALVVLVTWWFSHWRRRRRQDGSVEPTELDEAGDTSAALSPDAAEATAVVHRGEAVRDDE